MCAPPTLPCPAPEVADKLSADAVCSNDSREFLPWLDPLVLSGRLVVELAFLDCVDTLGGGGATPPDIF